MSEAFIPSNWEPPLHPILALAIGGGLLAAACWSYRPLLRVRPSAAVLLLGLRGVFALAITALLLGPRSPVSESSAKRTSQVRLNFVLDTSRSMRTQDVAGEPRVQYATERLLGEKKLQRLRRAFRLRLLGLDTRTRPLSPAELRSPAEELASGRATHIVEGLLDLVSSSDPGDIVLISDGHDTADTPVEPLIRLARKRDRTIHAVALGGPSMRQDRVVRATVREPYLFRGESGSVRVWVEQMGLDTETATVHLRGPGVEKRRKLRLQDRSRAELDFRIHPSNQGTHSYEVRVDPAKGEMQTANNRQRVRVRVLSRALRVLLLEGQPYWETRFIAEVLRSDPRIDLTRLTQIAVPENQAAEGRDLPPAVRPLSQYDVVVLGKGLESLLDRTAAAKFVEYVKEGGNLVFARGRPYDPTTPAGRALGKVLRPLQPVIWEKGLLRNTRLRLTEAGRAHPSFQRIVTGRPVRPLANLPRWSLLIPSKRTKPATRTLAMAAVGSRQEPAIVEMPFGGGRVLGILGQGMWQWRMRPSGPEKPPSLYENYWSSVIRWLAAASGKQASEGNPPGPSSSGRNRRGPRAGSEALHRSARPDFLKSLAQRTGGRFYTATEAEALGRELRIQRAARETTTRRKTQAWDPLWLLGALLVLPLLEWGVRRRIGLA